MAWLREKLGVPTIRARLILLMSASFAAFIAILTYNSIQIIQMTWNNITERYDTIVTMQCHTLDTIFTANNQYLIPLSTMTEDFELANKGKSDIESILSRIRILEAYKNANQKGTSIDGTFLYLSGLQEFLGTYSSSSSYQQRQEAKESIARYLARDEVQTRQWITLRTETDSLFCRILRIDNGYIGIWVLTDRLLSFLNAPGTAETDYLTFISERGEVLGTSAVFSEVDRAYLTTERYININGERYAIASHTFQEGKFCLAGLTNVQKMHSQLVVQYYRILAMATVLLVIIILGTYVLQKSVLSPIAMLLQTMNRIKQGEITAKIDLQNPTKEFQQVGDTFNSMIEEITRLKMDVYEEKIRQYRVKKQYYQIQIHMHFFTNTLNMIYQFAQIKNYELVQKLVIHLSAYYRYIAKNESGRVRLQEEIEHIQNYLEIQKMRYPYNLQTSIHIDPDVKDILLPPLLVQPFVENAIKYAVDMDAETKIVLMAERSRKGGEMGLALTIWDDGPGFPQDVLEAMNRGQSMRLGTRKPIGTYNVQQRLWMVYHGRASIAFYNREPHGAKVEIWIPCAEEEKSEE